MTPVDIKKYMLNAEATSSVDLAEQTIEQFNIMTSNDLMLINRAAVKIFTGKQQTVRVRGNDLGSVKYSSINI